MRTFGTQLPILNSYVFLAMTFGLKATILSSTALAGLINLSQFATSLAQHAQAADVSTNTTTALSIPKPRPAAILTPANPPNSATGSANFSAPATSTPASASSSVVAAQERLLAAGMKPEFAASYLEVQTKTGTPWQLLAAVHKIETGQSGDTSRTSSAGATGPMQFMPATFARYAQDGDGNGSKNITNFNDALLTAGHYLAAGGADKGSYTTALFNYNHSASYVVTVLGIAHRLGL